MAGTVSYAITRRDYANVGRATMLRNVRRRRFRARLAIMAALGALTGAGLAWSSGVALLIGGTIGAAYELVLIAVIVIGNYILLPRRTGRLFDQQRGHALCFAVPERAISPEQRADLSATLSRADMSRKASS